ncbi:unnamed protein product [Closterium sp. Naga37s-1]|nr:unnamed protein product [Closterium sp. Naga37s-1]CAI5505498.1 unnamed protein product [Closterium sp. Naga37s-1]
MGNAQANPNRGGRDNKEVGTRRLPAGRSARAGAVVGDAAQEVATVEQGLQLGAENGPREGMPAQGVPARVAWTRAAAAAAALESPPSPGVAVVADENLARTPTTGPTAAVPALRPRTAAAAMSKTVTSVAEAAGAGTAPLGAELTDQAGGTPEARVGAGDEAADDGESSAREVAVGEVPGHGRTGTSAGGGPAREEEAAKHRHLLRPQPHPRRLGAGLGPARPGPLAGWEQQEDSPDAPAPGVGVACPSSNGHADAAEGTHEAEAVIAVGADHEDTLERRGDTAERRQRTGTSRQRALQDQADERAAGLQPQNAAPRAAGRGRGRGRNGGRGPRDLAGAVAREKARSGNWRERHERPEEQVEGPMNEGEEEGGSEYMASQDAESEEASLEAERGVPVPTTNWAGGIGRERGEAPADVGESGPQQPNEAASRERDPSIIVEDEATWQRIHAWDLGPLQSSAQPFLRQDGDEEQEDAGAEAAGREEWAAVEPEPREGLRQTAQQEAPTQHGAGVAPAKPTAGVEEEVRKEAQAPAVSEVRQAQAGPAPAVAETVGEEPKAEAPPAQAAAEGPADEEEMASAARVDGGDTGDDGAADPVGGGSTAFDRVAGDTQGVGSPGIDAAHASIRRSIRLQPSPRRLRAGLAPGLLGPLRGWECQTY